MGVSIAWILRAQVQAQVSASRPEADTEYSRAPRASRGRPDASEPVRGRPASAVPIPALLGVLAGAILLLVAEFAPLLRVHSGAYHAGVIESIQTGPHHSYALIPVALLAVALAAVARMSGNRVALWSIGLLGLVALGIALLGDLPDVHTAGLLRQADGTFVNATSSAAAGMYLETLGAVVLLLGAGAGLLLAPTDQTSRLRLPAPRRRSAS